MNVELIKDPVLAQEMSDINHAAFGYPQLRPVTAHQIREKLKNAQYEAHGLMDGKHIIAFLFINHYPTDFIKLSDEKCIESFSVSPWRQGRGIGSVILDHVVNVVYPEFSFNLYVRNNSKAARLYEKFGFVNYGQVGAAWGTNYIAMGLIRWKERLKCQKIHC